MAMPPPQVAVASAVTKTVAVSYEYVGTTAASKVVEIRARVQGFLDTRDFQEGSYLKEGTRLFTIDARSFKADREIAAAQVEEAAARLKLAEQELKRLQSVNKPGAVAQADLDQKASERTSAQAALQLAKAQLAKADLELSYTTIAAPLTGYIGKTMKEIGSLVDGNLNSLLAVMEQVNPIYVSFQVSENDFLAWKRAEKEGELQLADGVKAPYVEITLLDGTAYEHQGALDFENVGLDTQTGTVELRATFKNDARTLKPGQFVKVRLNGWQRPNALTVPQRAVGQSPEGAYVYVVGADSKAERRTVTVGPWSGVDWIILDGLKEGEQVIVEGLTKIRPGSEVVIGSPPASPGSPPPSEAQPAR